MHNFIILYAIFVADMLAVINVKPHKIRGKPDQISDKQFQAYRGAGDGYYAT